MPERAFRGRELKLWAHRIAFASGQDVDAMLSRITMEQLYERICAYAAIHKQQTESSPSIPGAL